MNKTILHRLSRNWQVKLYMFLLAILLWFFVVTHQVYETGIEIPLDIVDIKPSKILVSDVPQTVSVRFAGPGKDLLILKYIQPARLELDIHTINYFYDYPILTDYVVVPPGVAVEPLYIIGPDTVNIRLEDEMIQRLPVIPRVEVQPEAGYILSKPVATSPESVTVSGPQSLVRRLRQIETEERIFVGLKETTEQEIPLVLPSDRMRIIPNQVRSLITIDKIGERLIQRVPVVARQVPFGRTVVLEPSTVDLRVQGPAERLANLTVDSLMVYIDLRRWRADVRDYTPGISLPEGIELHDMNPDLVRIRLERREGL